MAAVVVDKAWPTRYQMESGCRVGLQRFLRRAGYFSAPLSRSTVLIGMGPLRGQSARWEQSVVSKIHANVDSLARAHVQVPPVLLFTGDHSK